MKKYLFIVFIIGLALLVVNISGFFFSLRNPAIYEEPKTFFKNDITLSVDETYDKIARKKDESDKDYIFRLNKVIYNGLAFYWDDEGIEKYHLRIPFWENWLLYLASFIRPDIYRKYEYANYMKAIERGVGLCSQHALIMTGILEDEGIPAKIIGMGGHVVLSAKVHDNSWYVIDPDFGVIIPYDISEIEKNPQLTRPYYENVLKTEVQDRIKNIVPEVMDNLLKSYGEEEVNGTKEKEIYNEAAEYRRN
jgi:hypothetical protein